MQIIETTVKHRHFQLDEVSDDRGSFRAVLRSTTGEFIAETEVFRQDIAVDVYLRLSAALRADGRTEPTAEDLIVATGGALRADRERREAAHA